MGLRAMIKSNHQEKLKRGIRTCVLKIHKTIFQSCFFYNHIIQKLIFTTKSFCFGFDILKAVAVMSSISGI
jgi:hypothetical protein